MLLSGEQRVLKELMDGFGNKSFRRHQAQEYVQCLLVNAYRVEENDFKKNVKVVHPNSVTKDQNIISSHALYRLFNLNIRSPMMPSFN